jgi:nucleoside-diphosphate kinase
MTAHYLITLSIFAFLTSELQAEVQNQSHQLNVKTQYQHPSTEDNDEIDSEDDDDDYDWDDEEEYEEDENLNNPAKTSVTTQTKTLPQKQISSQSTISAANNRATAPIKTVSVKEQTISIIKPDAVQNNHIGEIISRFEQAGLKIAAIKMTTLTKDQASKFYAVHRDRPFYDDLVNFMSSGPVVIMVLEGNQAIAKNRELMGATDPKKAEKGTLRADFAESMSRNAVHGSDSPETAKEEILFFFKPDEITHR